MADLTASSRDTLDHPQVEVIVLRWLVLGPDPGVADGGTTRGGHVGEVVMTKESVRTEVWFAVRMDCLTVVVDELLVGVDDIVLGDTC
jgi:hypothetical protein